jgi:8-oxo-dGTP diphosphatase
MLALHILDETDEVAKTDGKGRPGKMYQFNKKRYQELITKRDQLRNLDSR